MQIDFKFLERQYWLVRKQFWIVLLTTLFAIMLRDLTVRLGVANRNYELCIGHILFSGLVILQLLFFYRLRRKFWKMNYRHAYCNRCEKETKHHIHFESGYDGHGTKIALSCGTRMTLGRLRLLCGRSHTTYLSSQEENEWPE